MFRFTKKTGAKQEVGNTKAETLIFNFYNIALPTVYYAVIAINVSPYGVVQHISFL